MKITTLIISLFCFSGTVFAGTGFTAECVRADSGDSPVLTLYSKDSSNIGHIVLSDGTGEIFNNLIFTVDVSANDVEHTLNGPISATIGTQGEPTYDQNVEVAFDVNNPALKNWFDENSNLLSFGDTTASFLCKN